MQLTHFKDLPIQRKLQVSFLGTATVALFVVCTAFILYAVSDYRKSMARNLTVLADALAMNSTAALTFANRDDATEMLNALSIEPSVDSGCLYTENGVVFAYFARGNNAGTIGPSPSPDGAHFEGDHLRIFRPVILNDKRIGTIHLNANLDGVHNRIFSYITIAGIVLLCSLLLVLVFSAGFQRIISLPILNLAAAARTITDSKDYSVRVENQTKDELGELTRSFNQMLADIQQRDRKLKETNDELRQQIEARNVAEKELKLLNEQLELRVQVRTRELQRSNQDLEQFAYVASHDLQEPLRMVTGYVQLLSRRYRGRLDPDADEFIAFAVDGAKRMQLLIQDLLTFSRVGTKGSEMKAIDLEAVFAEVTSNLELAIHDATAVITHDPLPTIYADSTLMMQLLQNLVGNAIKFRGTQPPVIHVKVDKKLHTWYFAVQDNGIGIEKKFHDRIFVIFQRLHTRGEYQGTGIGLALCRKIVERHGGKIWVESEPGKGTTFHFTISADLQPENKS